MSVDLVFFGCWEVVIVEVMEQFGFWIGEQLEFGDLFIFIGFFGVGKMIFIWGFVEGFGVCGFVQSLMFVIVCIYLFLVGCVLLVYVDVYWFGFVVELDDFDFDFEWLVVVIEWGCGMVEELVDLWWDIEFECLVGVMDDDLFEFDVDVFWIVMIVNEWIL